MPIQLHETAPYASADAIRGLIDRYRHRGLSAPVNQEALSRAAISEPVIPRTLQAMRLLELIDSEGMPTQAFERIRLAPEQEFRDRLAELLRDVYAEVFARVDPQRDGTTAVKDAFRYFKPIGMQDRMVRLFLGLCEYAGIVDEAPRRRAANAKQQRTAATASRTRPQKRLPAPEAAPVVQQIPPPLEDSPAISHPLIAGLIRELPQPGQEFPPDKQEAWFEIARATFRLIYKPAPAQRVEFVPKALEGGGSD